MLLSSTYGNKNTVTYEFDEEDRIKSDIYDVVTKYEYEYDVNGNIRCHTDDENSQDLRIDGYNELINCKIEVTKTSSFY